MRPIVPLLVLAAALAGCQAGSGEPANPEETADVAAGSEGLASPPPSRGAGEAAAPDTPESTIDECGANKLGRWLNVLPTETVKAEIAAASGHDRIRYIAPGDAVTMDFRPDRLNVETGEDGRIKLFRCG